MKQGTGETLAYGMDPWISEVDEFRPRPKENYSTSFALVTELIDMESKQWDRSKLMEVFDNKSS